LFIFLYITTTVSWVLTQTYYRCSVPRVVMNGKQSKFGLNFPSSPIHIRFQILMFETFQHMVKMVVRVFALNSKGRSEDVSHLSLDDIYRSWTPDKSSGFLLGILQRTINYEYQTFLQLMDRYFQRQKWENQANFQFMELPERGGIPWDENNYILRMLGGSNFQQDAELLYDRIGVLTDIYEKDTEWLTSRTSNYGMIFVITYNGRYYGHVYQEIEYDTPKTSGLIGIRTSLYNMFSDRHGVPSLKGLSYILLDAYNNYSKNHTNYERIYISQPIGPMVKLSRQYGFDNYDSLIPGTLPLVSIPQYELIL